MVLSIFSPADRPNSKEKAGESETTKMPLVTVQYDSISLAGLANFLADGLPKVVAGALTCAHPDGSLTELDVEVEVSLMSSGMRTRYNVRVIVEANEYPERMTHLGKSKAAIAAAIKTRITEYDPWADPRPKAWLWVRLCPGEWCEI
jgi:hypothetical protein